MGRLIVFEGPDGSGKTTQLQLTGKVLKAMGFNVKLTRHPGGTDAGKKMRAVIKDPVAARTMPPLARRLIFTADRLTHMVELRRELEEFDVVLMDRWDGVSTSAYGVVEGNNTQESEFCLNIGVEDDVPVDLVLIFDVTPDVAWERTDHEDLADSNRDLFERVNQAYAKFASDAAESGSIITVHGIEMPAKRIDADLSIKDIQLQVAAEIGKLL